MGGRLSQQRPRARVEVRDERGAPRRLGDLEVVPVARVYRVRLGAPGAGFGAALARPHRVEVRRAGILQSRAAVPDWGLRLSVLALLVTVASWVVRIRRRAR